MQENKYAFLAQKSSIAQMGQMEQHQGQRFMCRVNGTRLEGSFAEIMAVIHFILAQRQKVCA